MAYAGAARAFLIGPFAMAFDDDDLHGPNLAFQIGRLNARVDGLEGRQDKTDNILTSMDGKLDEIKLSLEAAVKSRRMAGSVARWIFFALASVGSFVVALVAALDFLKLH